MSQEYSQGIVDSLLAAPLLTEVPETNVISRKWAISARTEKGARTLGNSTYNGDLLRSSLIPSLFVAALKKALSDVKDYEVYKDVMEQTFGRMKDDISGLTKDRDRYASKLGRCETALRKEKVRSGASSGYRCTSPITNNSNIAANTNTPLSLSRRRRARS